MISGVKLVDALERVRSGKPILFTPELDRLVDEVDVMGDFDIDGFDFDTKNHHEIRNGYDGVSEEKLIRLYSRRLFAAIAYEELVKTREEVDPEVEKNAVFAYERAANPSFRMSVREKDSGEDPSPWYYRMFFLRRRAGKLYIRKRDEVRAFDSFFFAVEAACNFRERQDVLHPEREVMPGLTLYSFDKKIYRLMCGMAGLMERRDLRLDTRSVKNFVGLRGRVC